MNKLTKNLIHKKAWDSVAPAYQGGTALPSWGVRGELSNENILGDINQKTFLEIGCGSGDSLIYLLRSGAKHVTGIDFSEKQLELAKTRISQAFDNDQSILRRVTLINQTMDEKLPTGQFDCVLAIYSIGWSENLSKLLTQVFQRLKPGGYFNFSWDHYLARIISLENNKLVITGNYHIPKKLIRNNWKSTGFTIQTNQMRPSDWFSNLVKTGFVVEGFWEPQAENSSQSLPIYSNAYNTEISNKIPTCMVFKARK